MNGFPPDGPDADEPAPESILEDLGRLARAKRDRGDQAPASYEPPSPAKVQAFLDELLGTSDPEVADERPKPPKPRRVVGKDRPTRASSTKNGESPSHWLGYLVTAIATAAAIVLVVRSVPEPSPTPEEPPVPTARVEEASPPPFGSWRIDGGSPPPDHQGPAKRMQVCSDRPTRLTVAVASDATIDPEAPLQLVLVATPAEGPSHRLLFDIDGDQRFAWEDGGRALVLHGTLGSLAPLTPGTWVLEPRIGSPGACATHDDSRRCTFLPAMAIEVDGDDCAGAE